MVDEERGYVKTGSWILTWVPERMKVSLSDAYQRNMRKSISGKGKVFILDMLSLQFCGELRGSLYKVLKQGWHLNWEKNIIKFESLGNSDENNLKGTKKEWWRNTGELAEYDIIETKLGIVSLGENSQLYQMLQEA